MARVATIPFKQRAGHHVMLPVEMIVRGSTRSLTRDTGDPTPLWKTGKVLS
jgi:hypothetical protein